MSNKSDIHEFTPNNHVAHGFKRGDRVRVIANNQVAEIIMLPPWNEIIVCPLQSSGALSQRAVVCRFDEVGPLDYSLSKGVRSEDQGKSAKESWWNGARAALGFPPDTPREVVACHLTASDVIKNTQPGDTVIVSAEWKDREPVTFDLRHIKVGDVVRLKSGGPRMTVSDAYGSDGFTCQWFEGNDTGGYGSPCTENFGKKELEKVA